MPRNIVEKVIDAHFVEGQNEVGGEVGIRIDQTLTQDATGTMAYLQFEAMGIPRVRTELSVSYVDHNTLQMGFENADDHRYLQDIARKIGVYYSRAGNGICHQVHLERFGVPGGTLLGSDSHTPTNGGIGMIAIGAGGLDVAVAMGGGAFFIPYPRIYKIELYGGLKPWVTAKDVVLEVLRILTTKGNVGVIIEYGGPGVETLSVPERATITNMGAELGVTTSIFPSDEQTIRFLKAQNREESYQPLSADEGAHYDRVIEIDLSKLEPLVALPHSPGNVKKVSEVEGVRVDQVAIGSCTNSSYKDLTTVAKILKGKVASEGTSLVIAPGSKQVLEMIAREGTLADLVLSGARVMESACGFCIGAGQAPQSGGISLRTNNRNFLGRSGTKDAKIYLVSPEVAAVSAITGKITDPRAFSDKPPKVDMPSKFLVNDSMIIPPASEDEKVEIRRGPNIGAPPSNKPLKPSIEGEVLLKVGDKITTDHIMPAGAYLKYRSNVPKYSQYVFEILDLTFSGRALKNKEKGIDNIIVGGESYGQGSSREHAALCPMYLGVKAIIARSIERIHRANLVNFGIVPLLFINADDYERIGKGDQLSIENIRKKLESAEEVATIRNITQDFNFDVRIELTKRQRDTIISGGLLNYTTMEK